MKWCSCSQQIDTIKGDKINRELTGGLLNLHLIKFITGWPVEIVYVDMN